MADEKRPYIKRMRKDLTAEFVKLILDYDQTSGIFVWKNRPDVPWWWNGRFAGESAGSISADGYRYIKIDRVSYRASRIAWLYVTGQWPTEEVDHENTIRSDDRFENLREATPTQNSYNRNMRSDNKFGATGIHFHKSKGKWQAYIGHGGRLVHLGYFFTKDEAIEARQAAVAVHHKEFAKQ